MDSLLGGSRSCQNMISQCNIELASNIGMQTPCPDCHVKQCGLDDGCGVEPGRGPCGLSMIIW